MKGRVNAAKSVQPSCQAIVNRTSAHRANGANRQLEPSPNLNPYRQGARRVGQRLVLTGFVRNCQVYSVERWRR